MVDRALSSRRVTTLVSRRRLVLPALVAAAATLSVCTSQASANADPGLCADGVKDGGISVSDGNTTSISIDSGNVLAPSSTSTNDVVGNVAVGNGNGQSVCCVQNVCCAHSGGVNGDILSSCPPG
jgi:hypothetical protein